MKRLPVYLVIDCSRSMQNAIASLEEILGNLLSDLLNSERTRRQVWMSILTFSSRAELLNPLMPITEIRVPHLIADGGTEIGYALALLNLRMDLEVSSSDEWLQPQVVVMTDGHFEDEWQPEAHKLRVRIGNVIGIAVGQDAHVDGLRYFSNRVATLANHSRIRHVFQWLSRAIVEAGLTGSTQDSHSRSSNFSLGPGEKPELPPESPWRTADVTPSEATGDQVDAYFDRHFGNGILNRRALHKSIWQTIALTSDRAFHLSSIDLVAKAAGCAADEALSFLTILSSPRAGFLKMELISIADGDVPIPFESFVSKVRDWWKNDRISRTQLEDWARGVMVRWTPSATTTIPSTPADADDWYFRGRIQSAAGRPREAIQSFREALRTNPRSVEALCGLSDEVATFGQFEEALSLLLRALFVHPRIGETWRRLGDVLRRLERFQEAADCYAQALHLNPDDAEARAGLSGIQI